MERLGSSDVTLSLLMSNVASCYDHVPEIAKKQPKKLPPKENKLTTCLLLLLLLLAHHAYLSVCCFCVLVYTVIWIERMGKISI